MTSKIQKLLENLNVTHKSPSQIQDLINTRYSTNFTYDQIYYKLTQIHKTLPPLIENPNVKFLQKNNEII